MITDKTIRDKIRQRADYACKYCGVTETDTGGLLTIDHFQPQSKGGNDYLQNLIYCCNRCNSYKYSYFPILPSDPKIWNPRTTTRNQHFFELENGHLKGLTTEGLATINLLRLNRLPLINYRLQKKVREEETQLLKQYQKFIGLLQLTNQELSVLVNNQQGLLEQQQQLLKLLLDEDFNY